MANITGIGNLTGTAGADIIISTSGTNSIDGLGGNDVLIGDHDSVWVDSSAGNNSIANAINIDAATYWSTQPNPDLGDDTIPYTTIMGAGAGEFDYFELTVGVGETITLDIDYAGGTYGGSNWNTYIRLLNSSHTAHALNEDSSTSDGGLGSYSASDSHLTYTNPGGITQTFYIRVEASNGLPIGVGNNYLLNVSVTGHSNTNLYETGADTINGGDGDDIIYGMEGNDILNGDAGNDIILGGLGDDIIEGGAGADVLDGGAGTRDTLSYSTSSTGIHVALAFNDALFGDAAGDTIVNFENVIGSSSADTIRGDANANIIYGGGGGDYLSGHGGVDEIYGEAGNDFFLELSHLIGAGDRYHGGVGIDQFDIVRGGGVGTVDLRTSAFFNFETLRFFDQGGGPGDVVDEIQLYSHQRFSTVLASGHAGQTVTLTYFMDYITYSDRSGQTYTGFTEPGDRVQIFGDDDAEFIIGARNVVNNIDSGNGDDTIEGGALGDTLNGGGGASDTLRYAGSSFGVFANINSGTVSGGDATGDTISNFENITGSAFADTLIGTAGNNNLQGGDGDDTLSGGSGDDTLLGDGGNDTLNGGGGDDTLEGGAGDDILDGGGGFHDIVSYAGATERVLVNLTVGTSQDTLGAGSDTLSNFEGIIGTSYEDILIGDDGINFLNGNAGNDLFVTGLGADEIDGGAGNDSVNYSASTNTQKINLITNVNIGGYAHQDSLISIENVIGSNTRGDDITGTKGANTLKGLGADDRLRGHNGDDTLFGDEGNDFLYGGNGADYMDGGNGNDWAMYNGLIDAITVDLASGMGFGGQAQGDQYISIERVRGSLGDDLIAGSNDNNKLLGDNGNDGLYGRDGKDVLRGGIGNDYLDGGNGNDSLHGGAGLDTFIFELGSSHDFIVDFENNLDTINIDANLYGGGLTATQVVDTYMHMQTATRFYFDFGGGDVLHVLSGAALALTDFYDDVTIA